MVTKIEVGTQEIGNAEFRSLVLDMVQEVETREIIRIPPSNALSVGNSELLEVILNAGAIVAGIEGVFRCIRTYLKSRRQESVYLKYESLELKIDTNNLEEAKALALELADKLKPHE